MWPLVVASTLAVVSAQSLNYKPCVCVPFYQCSSEDVVDVFGSSATITQRFGKAEGCKTEGEICCRLTSPSDDGVEDLVVVPTKPRGYHGCGLKRVTIEEQFQPYSGDKPILKNTFFGEYPWVVGVWRNDGKAGSFLCSGVLIRETVVLTAAHCITSNPRDMWVTAGDWDADSRREPLKEQRKTVVDSETHPQYVEDTRLYDLALLRTEPFQLDEAVDVVCLSQSPPSDHCTLAGWTLSPLSKYEKPSYVRQASVPLLAEKECSAKLRQNLPIVGNDFQLHPSFVCTPGISKEVCKGLTGAGLVCRQSLQDPRYTVAAIRSWGAGNGPIVYTNVSEAYQWIEDHIFNWDIKIFDTELDFRVFSTPPDVGCFPTNFSWNKSPASGGNRLSTAAPVEPHPPGYPVDEESLLKLNNSANRPVLEPHPPGYPVDEELLLKLNNSANRPVLEPHPPGYPVDEESLLKLNNSANRPVLEPHPPGYPVDEESLLKLNNSANRPVLEPHPPGYPVDEESLLKLNNSANRPVLEPHPPGYPVDQESLLKLNNSANRPVLEPHPPGYPVDQESLLKLNNSANRPVLEPHPPGYPVDEEFLPIDPEFNRTVVGGGSPVGSNVNPPGFSTFKPESHTDTTSKLPGFFTDGLLEKFDNAIKNPSTIEPLQPVPIPDYLTTPSVQPGPPRRPTNEPQRPQRPQRPPNQPQRPMNQPQRPPIQPNRPPTQPQRPPRPPSSVTTPTVNQNFNGNPFLSGMMPGSDPGHSEWFHKEWFSTANPGSPTGEWVHKETVSASKPGSPTGEWFHKETVSSSQPGSPQEWLHKQWFSNSTDGPTKQWLNEQWFSQSSTSNNGNQHSWSSSNQWSSSSQWSTEYTYSYPSSSSSSPKSHHHHRH